MSPCWALFSALIVQMPQPNTTTHTTMAATAVMNQKAMATPSHSQSNTYAF